MKVSLVDVDGHNYPNLALMKLSAWHKAQGDTVDWYSPLFSRPDRIYASKVFTFTPDYTEYAACDPEPIRGGTGYDVLSRLPAEAEAMLPDYSIYPQYSEAYGFLSRGCIRHCPWCVVPVKEGKIRPVADIEDVAGDRREVVLMDNNFLANDESFVREQLEKMAQLKLRVDFNQGLDARLVNADNARLLARVKWSKYIRFACDTVETLSTVCRAMHLLAYAGYRKEFFVFILAKDIESALFRIDILTNLAYKVSPFVQPYRDFLNGGKVISEELKHFARWANRKEVFWSCDWEEYKYNHATEALA